VKAFLPAMLERNHGHIVSIASLAGWIGSCGMADYSASKFAAVGFNESLRMELAALGMTGVRVTCVCPFFVSTGMCDGVRPKFPSLMPLLQPDHVVSRIMDGVLCNQELVIIPRDMNLFITLKTLLPVRAFTSFNNYFSGQMMDEFRGRQKEE